MPSDITPSWREQRLEQVVCKNKKKRRGGGGGEEARRKNKHVVKGDDKEKKRNSKNTILYTRLSNEHECTTAMDAKHTHTQVKTHTHTYALRPAGHIESQRVHCFFPTRSVL